MPDENPSPDLVSFLQKEFSISNLQAGVLPRNEDLADYATKSGWLGRDMTPGEVGCAVAHRRVMKRFVESDSDWALVLENDVIVCNPRSILELLSGFAGTIPVVLMLGFNSEDVPSALLRSQWFRLPSIPTGTFSYAISRPAAESFLVDNPFNFGPADWPPYGSASTKFRILNPPIFKHPDTRDGSTIKGRERVIRRFQGFRTLFSSWKRVDSLRLLGALFRLTLLRDMIRTVGRLNSYLFQAGPAATKR